MDNREADNRLQRIADFCQRLPLLGIEHTDEIVVAIIAAVFILYLEAAIIGRLKHRVQGIILGRRDSGNRVRSGLGLIDFHNIFDLSAPRLATRCGVRLILSGIPLAIRLSIRCGIGPSDE